MLPLALITHDRPTTGSPGPAPRRGGDSLTAAAGPAAPLVDRFGRTHTYLRISVTDRCNFRCRYCMPASGLRWRDRDELLSDGEILRIARVFAGLGVRKVRLTGGEPTVRPGIERLIAGIAAIDGIASVHLTTNGYALASAAHRYRDAGLAGINISVDSLRADRFRQITRRDGLDAVLAGVDAAVDAGIPVIKVNTVVMAGVNHDELVDFVDYVRDRPITVRFIEFMPFQCNGWSAADVYPYQHMRRDIERSYRLIPAADGPSAVARDFRIDGHMGRVGFITSMTDSFCATCNRIRLTADGQIKACLFSNAEFSVRDLLRSGAQDHEVVERIRGAVSSKEREHAPMEELLHRDNRSMIQIGG